MQLHQIYTAQKILCPYFTLLLYSAAKHCNKQKCQSNRTYKTLSHVRSSTCLDAAEQTSKRNTDVAKIAKSFHTFLKRLQILETFAVTFPKSAAFFFFAIMFSVSIFATSKGQKATFAHTTKSYQTKHFYNITKNKRKQLWHQQLLMVILTTAKA